jgi:hypothetical protein
MQNLKRYKIQWLVASGLLLAASCAPLASAQTLGIEPVQYVVSPQTPGPGEQVTIEAQGVGSFLGDATVTWQENGATVLSGVGARDFSFTAGALGVPTRVHVEIDSSSQGTFTHDFTIVPSAVELVWEADTTVPPFYQGKALYSAGSQLKVVAFPSVFSGGARIAAGALSYQWTVDGTPAAAQSGLGASSITFQGNQLNAQEDVSVDVYYGGAELGSAEVLIPAQSPELVLYADDPLRGVLWDEALPAEAALTGQELTVAAVPYFFSNASSRAGALVYDWTLNGADTSGPGSAQGMLTLRQTGSGTGAAQLGVSLQNNDTDKLVQAASAALTLVFGQTAASIGSLFGL